jgi:hypothetical protein
MSSSVLSSISTGASTLGNLILVSPQSTIGYQPQSTPTKTGAPPLQKPALLFHYEGENRVSLRSDITDHYVEDNTSIQDQWALPPAIITVQGFIGELNDVPPNKFFQALQQAAQKLTVISAYTPGLSTTALIAYNEAVFAYNTANTVVDSAVAAYSSITGQGGTSVINSNGIQTQPNQTKQQQYFQQFYEYRQSRTLFTVQTPWAIFQDMAILSLDAVQGADTNVISEFAVTFKQMRFASTQTTNLYSDNSNFSGRLFNQGAQSTTLGTSNLTSSTTSFTSTLPK